MRALVVCNPAAHRGRSERAQQVIERQLQAHAIEFDLVRTSSPGHASDVVARGRDYDTIVVAGGDGTLHEALQTLDLERQRLGVVPCGTGNDFAWMNGIPGRVEAAVARIAAGRERRIDIGSWGSKRFHNSIGIGFEGAVNQESQQIPRLRGASVYLLAVLRTLRKRRQWPARLQWDEDHWDGELFMASVCLGQRVGGAFRLAPAARNDDGRLDLMFSPDGSLGNVLRLLPRTFRGSHVGAPSVRTATATRIVLSSDAGLPVHVDGEFVGPAVRRLEIGIQPGALRLL